MPLFLRLYTVIMRISQGSHQSINIKMCLCLQKQYAHSDCYNRKQNSFDILGARKWILETSFSSWLRAEKNTETQSYLWVAIQKSPAPQPLLSAAQSRGKCEWLQGQKGMSPWQPSKFALFILIHPWLILGKLGSLLGVPSPTLTKETKSRPKQKLKTILQEFKGEAP